MTWIFFSMATRESITNIYEELDRFKLQSGFTVSYEKTTLYRIGSLRYSNAQMYDLDQFIWSNEDINVLGVQIAHEDIIMKNYEKIIDKVKMALSAWYNRGLSLIGKIQVINTLVASLFVYHMMVLPRIPTIVVKRVYNIFRDFIWNGKKAKISLSILQNPKKEGGLDLVDLQKKDQALKATWPQILFKEKDYALLVYSLMRVSLIGDLIWKCSIKPEDVKELKIKSEFWSDVLRSWCAYNRYNNFKLENQIIWYNSDIKVQKKMIMWGDAYKRGLIYVYQLFESDNFKTHEKIEQEFGLSTLRYNSLKVALPQEWKVYFSQERGDFLPLPPHNYSYWVNDPKDRLSKRVYEYMSDDRMLIHSKYIKWKMELGVQDEFCNSLYEFSREHCFLYTLTNVPKYRSFQYRLLERGIVTNIHLCKWGIREDSNCTFCNQEEESLLHLFCTCNQVKVLWENFRQYVEEKYQITSLNLNPSEIVLNKIFVPVRSHVVNFLCLVTKQFIYRQRCQGNNLTFPVLRNIFRRIEGIEKYIAIKNGRIGKHIKKWGYVQNGDCELVL